jgi:hypothetical protein
MSTGVCSKIEGEAVSCGKHQAENCNACGESKKHCNGDCKWIGAPATGQCVTLYTSETEYDDEDLV